MPFISPLPHNLFKSFALESDDISSFVRTKCNHRSLSRLCESFPHREDEIQPLSFIFVYTLWTYWVCIALYVYNIVVYICVQKCSLGRSYLSFMTWHSFYFISYIQFPVIDSIPEGETETGKWMGYSDHNIIITSIIIWHYYGDSWECFTSGLSLSFSLYQTSQIMWI